MAPRSRPTLEVRSTAVPATLYLREDRQTQSSLFSDRTGRRRQVLNTVRQASLSLSGLESSYTWIILILFGYLCIANRRGLPFPKLLYQGTKDIGTAILIDVFHVGRQPDLFVDHTLEQFNRRINVIRIKYVRDSGS